jgi:hypothetical protein
VGDAAPGPAVERLMLIFSLGGLILHRHLRAGAVRCSTALLPLGDGELVLDPFPGKGSRGVVGADGRPRLWRDGVEVPDPGGRGLRWSDHQLVDFVATNLTSWIRLPLAVEERGPGEHEVDGHVLWVAEDGRVTRHREPATGLTHHLRDHCEFGGVMVATRRRTYDRRGIPVLWADVVAGHAIPAKSLN